MIFTFQDQLVFSELSQDFNPMHCDEVLARRLIYGEPVVHGINAMIIALKEWSKSSTEMFSINKLRCKFTKPIFLNKKIYFEIKNIEDSVKINLIQDDEIKIRVIMSIASANHSNEIIKKHDSLTKKQPNNISFEDLKTYSKSINCSIDAKLAEDYYSKKFIQKIGHKQLAEILSFSRIVGMHSPGLNSIFSELNIHKTEKENKDIYFKVKSVDDRFNLIHIESNGPNFKSDIKAFYRPMEVKQKNIKDIKANLSMNEFKNFRALVIGASRGLGELTAKCLGFGGASMLLTYARGKNDILNVLNDVKKYNSDISITSLDVTKIEDKDFEVIDKFKPTHIFYYATPFIFSGKKNKFSKEIYHNFRIYYLDAFEIIVKRLVKHNTNMSILYPSSVAVEENPSDMLEYSQAKKEGEKLCLELIKKYSNIKILCPRLPRLETDQTVSLSSVKNEDPIQILDIIRTLKNKS